MDLLDFTQGPGRGKVTSKCAQADMSAVQEEKEGCLPAPPAAPPAAAPAPDITKSQVNTCLSDLIGTDSSIPSVAFPLIQ